MRAELHRINRGFTLIEILVVLVISVGLVITMALLFRAVAQTTVILRGSNDEWGLQDRLREQLKHVLVMPGEPALSGDQRELVFATWKSQPNGFSGKPVIAQYRYESRERAIYYREKEMPAWWHMPVKLSELRFQLQQSSETRVASGIDEFKLEYLASEASDIKSSSLQTSWQKTEIPRIVELGFVRAGRLYRLHIETRGLETLPSRP